MHEKTNASNCTFWSFHMISKLHARPSRWKKILPDCVSGQFMYRIIKVNISYCFFDSLLALGFLTFNLCSSSSLLPIILMRLRFLLFSSSSSSSLVLSASSSSLLRLLNLSFSSSSWALLKASLSETRWNDDSLPSSSSSSLLSCLSLVVGLVSLASLS